MRGIFDVSIPRPRIRRALDQNLRFLSLRDTLVSLLYDTPLADAG